MVYADNILMDEIKRIPTSADLLKEATNKVKPGLLKTRGITADMVAAAEAMFKSNPVAPAGLSGTNHRKKKELLPPSNYIG
jgi:hypothetical protein